MFKKLFLMLSFALVLSGTAFGQSNLPVCTESDTSSWDNCFGSQITAKGNKYIGEWKAGKREGQGALYFLSNDQYMGHTYVGGFKSSKFDGSGTYTFPDGRKYVGEWKDDKQNGLGVWTYADGATYSGEWKDGKYNGIGVIKYINGEKDVGQWKDGAMNGLGIQYYRSGRTESGIFENGKLVVRKYVNPITFEVTEAQRLEADRLKIELEAERQKLAEEKAVKAAEEKRIQQAEETRKYDLAWEKLAEQRRIQEAKAAEERRLQEAKEAEEKRIQEAKDAKAAEERRIWLTTPEGKKFAAAEEAKAKKEEAERQRAAAIEEAKAKKEEAERQKAAAIEEARLAEAQRQEALRIAKEKANYAKDFPYYAIIDCTYGKQATPLLSCLSGSRSKIELRNGSQYGLYMPHEFQSIGVVGQYGSSLTINLRSKFSLVAENTAKYESLGVKIIDRKSDKVLWEKKVSQYDSIRVSN